MQTQERPQGRPRFGSIALYALGAAMLCTIFFAWGAQTMQRKVFPYALLAPDTDTKDPGAAEREQARRLAVGHREWAEKVVRGGYILHFRHAQREKWTDVTAFDAYELKRGIDAEASSFRRATCLTARGVEEAKLIGELFAMTGVKVSQIVTSPSCRARQTAVYAFGRYDAVDNALLHRTAMIHEQHDMFARQLRKRMESLKPEAGSNIVLSGHGGTLSYDGATVIDVNEVDDIDGRDETGFIVIERVGDKFVARHKFKSIRDFANAIVELPAQATIDDDSRATSAPPEDAAG